MTNYSVRLGSTNAIKVRSTTLGSGGGGGGGGGSIRTLSDVDITSNGLADGMVLVYDASTAKWKSSAEITVGNTRNMTINGGTF
jgi:hypothetical protein|tara:strand:- start:31847 stop:32098 length:252 start_codon:yes stop_codon:yes gene_type:complete